MAANIHSLLSHGISFICINNDREVDRSSAHGMAWAVVRDAVLTVTSGNHRKAVLYSSQAHLQSCAHTSNNLVSYNKPDSEVKRLFRVHWLVITFRSKR